MQKFIYLFKKLSLLLGYNFPLLIPSAQSCGIDWPNCWSTLPECPCWIHYIPMLIILEQNNLQSMSMEYWIIKTSCYDFSLIFPFHVYLRTYLVWRQHSALLLLQLQFGKWFCLLTNCFHLLQNAEGALWAHCIAKSVAKQILKN